MDSGALSIPLDKCRLIDNNLQASILTTKVNLDTGEEISEKYSDTEPFIKYFEYIF